MEVVLALPGVADPWLDDLTHWAPSPATRASGPLSSGALASRAGGPAVGGDSAADDVVGAPIVLAIDGGYRLARQLGLAVTELIGDLDSIGADDLAHAGATGVAIDRWPQRKDFTDLELGLRRAEALGATSITCLGGAGGRVDHLFTNLFVLAGAAARLTDVAVRWNADGWSVDFVTPSLGLALDAEARTTFSVLSPLGDADCVTISGASYPLDQANVVAGTGLGVSNVASGGTLAISVERGVLAVVWPATDESAGQQPSAGTQTGHEEIK